MAKRTAKPPASTEGAQTEPIQIPETGPDLPNPWDTIAATAPKLPGTGELTAITPRVGKSKPTPPSGANDFDPSEVQRAKASLLHPMMTLTRPAMSRMTVLGTELFGSCAMANELGNREPTKALVTFSSDRLWLYLMPVNHTADKAVKIIYRQNQACINLWGPFEETGKSVEKGYRENYPLEMTDEPIMIHGVKGYALFVDLEHPQKEAIRQRDGASTGSTSTGRASPARAPRSIKRSTATAASPAAGQAKGSAAPADEPDEPIATLHELNAMLDERDAQLDDRDVQIGELEKRLASYEQKYGKL